MSKTRLPETRPSPPDVTPLGQAALQRLARKVLARYSGSSERTEALAAAARRAYEDLVRVSTPLIGQVGVAALIARALHLAQREHPWLTAAPDSDHTHDPFASVIIGLSGQTRANAAEGTAAVFAAFAGLLVTFIGESLTAGLLRKAWPEAFSGAETKEI